VPSGLASSFLAAYGTPHSAGPSVTAWAPIQCS